VLSRKEQRPNGGRPFWFGRRRGKKLAKEVKEDDKKKLWREYLSLFES
jgi:hypothetical protein